MRGGSLQVNGCLFSLASSKQVHSTRFLGFVLLFFLVFLWHYTVICFNGMNFYLIASIVIVWYYVLITNTVILKGREQIGLPPKRKALFS